MTNREPSELFAYTFKPLRRCSLQHLATNFKNLPGMELTRDLTLRFLSSINNELCFFFVTGVGCNIECVGTAESTDILYISARFTCTIKVSDKENWRGANI